MTEINDAQRYGVEIIPAAVEAGEHYWQVVSVHHLTPAENNGRHHILLNAVNDANARMSGEMFRIAWDGGSDTLIIDADAPEAAANYPMWKWQICSVEGLGAPSDQVINLRTDHPDEAPGNSLFHHSFAITFRYTQAQAAAAPAASRLRGRVPGGGGHTLALLDATGLIKTQVVAADERYHFDYLPAGVYVVQNQSDGRVLGAVHLDGKQTVTRDFTPQPPQTRAFDTYLLLADAASAETQLQLSLLADYLAVRKMPFGFDVEAAVLAQQVYVLGQPAPDVMAMLESAGCQVTALPAEPGPLLAALRG